MILTWQFFQVLKESNKNLRSQISDYIGQLLEVDMDFFFTRFDSKKSSKITFTR